MAKFHGRHEEWDIERLAQELALDVVDLDVVFMGSGC